MDAPCLSAFSSGIGQGGFVLVGWVVMRILRSIVMPCPPPLWQPGVWWLQCVLVWLAPWREGAPGVCWSCPRMVSCPHPLPCARLVWFYSAQKKEQQLLKSTTVLGKLCIYEISLISIRLSNGVSPFICFWLYKNTKILTVTTWKWMPRLNIFIVQCNYQYYHQHNRSTALKCILSTTLTIT